jgi:hypothetical protein
MTYSLMQLAPGAYDLLLNGEVIASVVRNSSHRPYTWTAELLEALASDLRPAPFIEVEHAFPTLEEVCHWLGNPEIKANNAHGGAWER